MHYLLGLTLLGAAPHFTAVGADGTEVTGELVGLSLDRIVLRTPSGEQRRSAGEVSRLRVVAGDAPALATGVVLTLRDGSRVNAARFAAAGDRATADLGGVPLDCPTAAIRAVRFREQSPEIGAQWERILQMTPKADLIVIREQQSIDYLEGVLGDVAEDVVDFTLEGQKVPVRRTKVEGLIYYRPAEAAAVPAPCVVVDRGGSRFETASLALESERIRLRTSGGVDVELPLERVAAVEFPAHYLSQQRPERAVATPHVKPPAAAAAMVERFYRPRFDEALDGEIANGDLTAAAGAQAQAWVHHAANRNYDN